ncbi:unnamed protein product, partial [marine sediment metagenome]
MNTCLLRKENKTEEFYIDNYLSNIKVSKAVDKKHLSERELFLSLCWSVQSYFEDQWNKAEGQESKIL